MPCYEYQCQECGHIFTEMHDIYIRLRNRVCPKCDQWVRVNRLISRSTFILKGPGWSQAGYQGENNA